MFGNDHIPIVRGVTVMNDRLRAPVALRTDVRLRWRLLEVEPMTGSNPRIQLGKLFPQENERSGQSWSKSYPLLRNCTAELKGIRVASESLRDNLARRVVPRLLDRAARLSGQLITIPGLVRHGRSVNYPWSYSLTRRWWDHRPLDAMRVIRLVK